MGLVCYSNASSSINGLVYILRLSFKLYYQLIKTINFWPAVNDFRLEGGKKISNKNTNKGIRYTSSNGIFLFDLLDDSNKELHYLTKKISSV